MRAISLLSNLLFTRGSITPVQKATITEQPIHLYATPHTNTIEVSNLNTFYGSNQILFNVTLPIEKGKITALIGPSGCGKSTFLKTLNRMNDVVDNFRIEGLVNYSGENIYDNSIDICLLRKRIGMVFQKANPFPKSIYENIAFPQKIAGINKKKDLDRIVKESLIRAGLWDEVHHRLNDSGLSLSGGQQQRLCIARALAADPEVLLMDEPASALDPASTEKVEDLIFKLAEQGLTVVIITHNMQQAARVANGGKTGFFYLGKLIEFGDTNQIFTNPQNELTERFITGKFG